MRACTLLAVVAELETQVEAIVNSVDVTASSEEVMAFIMENMGEME